MVDPLLCNKHLMSYKCTGGGASKEYLSEVVDFFVGVSNRKLDPTATTYATVVESDGGTEAIIGFSGEWRDDAAIASHCGAFDGSLSKWDDQSGNGWHFTQATVSAQFVVYESSTPVTDGGKPAVRGGTGRYMVTADFGSQAQPNTYFGVCNFDSNPSSSWLFSGIDYPGATNGISTTGAPLYRLNTGAAQINVALDVEDIQGLASGLFDGASSSLRWNGDEKASGSPGTQGVSGITLGNLEGATTLPVGKISEFVMCNDDQSANYGVIEGNQADTTNGFNITLSA